ncbi:M23 family metallopeptidase [Marinifilum sp. RC60d5]|uniref:M23 family metallopeptidase n=1 Tax=Marinifilum sp. RC60d5 TaxID=3458414 RepID=UPI0040362743
MKLIKTNIITLLHIALFCASPYLKAQPKTFQKNIFRSPVDFTITLSGNFAELRNNHFHSGIDIRTFTTGKKVYSVADGYVSRIKVSANGYGNAIYINHPSGYTSVYGHLDKYNAQIEKFVKAQQYQRKSFELDLHLKKEQFPVLKGQIIAFSGNTGASGGPHLHFEIRDTKSEHPLNPLLFGFKIKDTTPPKIFNLYIYPLDSISSVNGKNVRQKFPVTFYNNAYHLKSDPKISLAGNIGFAINTNDYLDNTWGKCGIYKMQVKVNDTLISDYSFNEFSFDESRYINSHMDYELNILENRRVHKTFKDKNNKLSIYTKFRNNGIFNFINGEKYKIDFICSDTKNNIAKLRVYARGVSSNKIFPSKNYTKLMLCNEENTYNNENLEVKFPNNSFYTDLKFNYSLKKDSNFLSDIHSIHNNKIPIHNYYTLAIKANNIPNKLKDKVLIAAIGNKGKLSTTGGVYINGWVKTKTRTLGDFAIVADTIAPTVISKTKFKLKNLRGQKNLSFKIEDKLSGIKSYRGEIDGSWVLFEYDAKNNHLFYTFDKKRLLPKRKHQLSLTVTDHLGNSTHVKKEFFW